MDKRKITAAVVQTVAHVQEMSGRPSVGIDVSTRPVGGVEGFDSLNGVEATVMLSESLGIDIPEDHNPFVSSNGKRALSVSEIVDKLYAYAKTEVVTR